LIAGAESMKAAMLILEQELSSGQAEGPALEKVVIGTIEGDIHDIGKNLVASMLSAHGFEVLDLGADVKLERFIETAVEKQARFICLSALLTTTMLGQKRLVEMRRERGLEGSFRILVGGAPVNAEWAKAIGADAYGENAMAAVRAVQSLC
jgi:trimethylamine corrinoid protein